MDSLASQQTEALKLRSASDPEKYTHYFRDGTLLDAFPRYQAVTIFEGFADHLLYRTGEKVPPPGWAAVQPLPDMISLARLMTECLASYPLLCEDAGSLAHVLGGCACVFETPLDVDMLMARLIRLAAHPDPEPSFDPDVQNTPLELCDLIRKSVRARAADTAILLAVHMQEKALTLPGMLLPLLFRFATDRHEAVRAALLNHLTRMARCDADTAWKLCRIILHGTGSRLWSYAKPFFQERYAADSGKVRPYLEPERRGTGAVDIPGWTRMLSGGWLFGQLEDAPFIHILKKFGDEDLWISVFAALRNALVQKENPAEKAGAGLVCLVGNMPFTGRTLPPVLGMFEPPFADWVDIQIQIAYTFILSFRGMAERCDLSGFYGWLLKIAGTRPDAAIQLCEHLLEKLENSPARWRTWQRKKFAETMIRILQKTECDDNTGLMSRAVRLHQRETRD